MGNCVGGGGTTTTTTTRSSANGGDEQVQEMIKVVTSTGGVMELYAPITAANVTNEFPGHRLFCGGRTLHPTDNLHVGRLYHLLPILSTTDSFMLTSSASPAATPYRMSFAHESKSSRGRGGGGGGYCYKYCSNPYAASQTGQFKRNSQSYLGTTGSGDVWSRSCGSSGSGSGVWKVRLVINPEHLSEILSQDARTEELIESVRTVAKCSSGSRRSDGGLRKSGGRCSW